VEALQPRGFRPDTAATSGGNNVTVTSSCLPEFSKVGAWPSCYRFSTFNASWHEAREYCSAFGANLLALDSLKEAHIIDYLLNSKPGKPLDCFYKLCTSTGAQWGPGAQNFGWGSCAFRHVWYIVQVKGNIFPRDAHSARRGIAMLMLSLRLSVCNSRYHSHIGWLQIRIISPVSYLGAPRSAIYSCPNILWNMSGVVVFDKQLAHCF